MSDRPLPSRLPGTHRRTRIVIVIFHASKRRLESVRLRPVGTSSSLSELSLERLEPLDWPCLPPRATHSVFVYVIFPIGDVIVR